MSAQVLFPDLPHADGCRDQVAALTGAGVERIVCLVLLNAKGKERLKLLFSHESRHVPA